ncbi:MAG TPA: hypothetical protein VKS78_14285 [Roseiarcus sp.]|nr:hypothetical protein [Roseiarcus sp.]
MRTIIFTSAALALALGATSAYAMGGGGAPSWISPWASPYAVLAPQTVAPLAEGPAVIEGRSAFVGDSAPVHHRARHGYHAAPLSQ